MGEDNCRLTVFFEDPFWVGVFERTEGGRVSAAKVTFGAEPKDYEIYAYVLKHYYHLPFPKSVSGHGQRMDAEQDAAMGGCGRVNPKRMQRLVHKQMQNTGIGTKAQQALKQQQEQCKLERKARSRQQKEAEEERIFRIRQQKKKDKHRGH